MAKITYLQSNVLSDEKLLKEIDKLVNQLSMMGKGNDKLNYTKVAMELNSLIKEAKIRRLKLDDMTFASKILFR